MEKRVQEIGPGKVSFSVTIAFEITIDYSNINHG